MTTKTIDDDLGEVRTKAKRYHRRIAALDAPRDDLYDAIRRARAAGHSLRDIAQASGFTFKYIRDITTDGAR